MLASTSEIVFFLNDSLQNDIEENLLSLVEVYIENVVDPDGVASRGITATLFLKASVLDDRAA